jgi:RNA polymerase sigma-70 factor (ECF subfamily)
MPPDASAAEIAVDVELIERWRKGDQRAARELVERHAQSLARFAASQGVRDDVEELVQDTFVRAFGAIESFRADSSFRTWLFTIERRLLLDRRRGERRRKDDSEIEERDAATGFDALDSMVAEETARRIREAVAGLSPMQRDVFTLRLNEGLSYKEIAEVLGTTEGAARVHYHNAVGVVRELLDDDAKT